MISGGVWYDGRTELEILVLGKKTIKAEQYLNTFKTIYLPVCQEEDLVFQQDNAPCHTAKIVKAYFNQIQLNRIKWPARSPDLSPIEKIWKMLKDQLRVDDCKTQEEFNAKIRRAWKNIP
jgi:transposase